MGAAIPETTYRVNAAGAQPRPKPVSLDDCFDGALATSLTRILPIAAVVDPLPVTHLPERIAAYRRAMERGDRFPPIAVVRIVGRYWVADGHKRFSAYRSLTTTEILVEVWTTRRWLHDQWRQFRTKTRQQWHIISRSPTDAGARAQARRLFWDTLGHWQRICAAIVYRFSGRG